jgi:hypothetical protein
VEAALGAVDGAVDGAVREQQEAYVEALQSGVLEPLRDAVQAAYAAHGTARTAVDATRRERRAVWAEVVAYRHQVVDGVWRPLRVALADLSMGEQCRACRKKLREARAALADSVPETIARPEPDDLYAPDASDGFGRRVRKAGVRLKRRLQEVAGAGDARRQHVPVADLVRYHAAIRLPEAEAGVLAEVDERLAGWVAELERTAASWTHALLEAERLLDSPAFHRAPDGDAQRDAGGVDAGTADPGGPDVDPERLLESVQAEADRLDDVLEEALAAGGLVDPGALTARLSGTADTAQADLEADCARAGSFMAATRPSDPPRRIRRRRQDRQERVDAWPDWHRQAVDRLALMAALCALRETVAAAQDMLVDNVVAAGVAPVQDVHAGAVDALEALAGEARDLLDAPAPGEERALLVAVDRLSDRAVDAVEQSLMQPLAQLSVRRRMRDAVDLQVHALEAVVAAQPETFTVHPRPEPGDAPVDPRVDEHDVQWQGIVGETLDELLFDAWRAALPPLVDAAETATQQAEEVRQVVQFNLGAALEEVQDLIAARRRGEDGTAQIDNARELVVDGLRRSVDLIQEARTSLSGVRGPFADAVWTAGTKAWTRLHDRARSAGRAREHVLRIQTLLTYRLRDVLADVQRKGRRASVQVRRALQVGKRRTEELVRLGQTAVGVGEVDRSARRETVAALSSVAAILETLPVVYRRLFSFRPVMDPNLLVAREDDLQVVEHHAEQWQQGLANALVLTGPPGSGLTSLLNVLRKTTLRTARRHTIDLTERIESEAAFAVKVVRALGLDLDVNLGGEAAASDLTLDAVAETLNDAPRPDRLRVCTVEHLEHAFCRTVGGTQLMERILSFLSETDTRVLWIGTMSTTAWQAVSAYEPSAAGLVVQHELDDFDREELEALIMRRHRRSGLRLAFDRPDERSAPILARRVRAAAGEEERQRMLREDFFDRLYALCGQNVMLGLFYWFRAAHLDPDDAEQGVLHVRPLRPISFDYLESFSLSQAFALKALLDHRSLTVPELADVLQVDATASHALLESLGNALLIAPASSLDPLGSVPVTSVDRRTRYRIRPLVIHPVTRFLRSRNILH